MFELIFLQIVLWEKKSIKISIFSFPKIIFREYFSCSVRIYAKVYNNNHILLWGLNEMIISYFLEAWVCYVEFQACSRRCWVSNWSLLHANRNTPDSDVVRRFSSFHLIYYRGKRKANCKHFQRCIFYVWMMAWIGKNEIE